MAVFREFFASVVVFLVALPLCLGIAVASGVPPAMGLVAGIVGGIVVGSLAGSPLQVTGPAAGLVVICSEIIHEYDIATLGVIVVAAGLLQLAAGATGIARWFRAVAPAVIYAMLAGIGVLIFASQFHVMVDDTPATSGLTNLATIPAAISKGLFGADGDVHHHLAARVGAMTLLILIGWTWLQPRLPSFLGAIPGALVAVVTATGVARLMSLPIDYVDIPSKVTELFVLPSASTYLKLLEPGVLAEVFAVAAIASAESLLCANAVDKLHDGPRSDLDKELRAQGIGNALSGFLGGLPVTGVIVRSSANVQAGGKTRASAIMHGFWLLGAVALFPALIAIVPKSALAAVLVFIGFKLMNPSIVKELAARGRAEVAIFLATVFLIVSISLLEGLIIGLGLSLLRLAWMLSHLDIVRTETRRPSGLRIDLDLRGAGTFVGLPRLAEELESVPQQAEVHLHLEHLDYIDHACIEFLGDWERQLASRGGTLVVEWAELERRSGGPAATRAA